MEKTTTPEQETETTSKKRYLGMTRRRNMIALAMFFGCIPFFFVSAGGCYVVFRLTPEYIISIPDYFMQCGQIFFSLTGYLMMILFPFSIVSYMFSTAYKYMFRYNEWITKGDDFIALQIFIWKELLEEDKN